MADDLFSEYITALYECYYNDIYRYCYVLLDKSVEDAVDCACDVFEAAQKYEDKLKKHPNVVGWLKKTACNRIKRILRKRMHMRAHEVIMSDTSERYMESLQYIQNFDEEATDDISAIKDDILAQLDFDELKLYEMRFVDNLTIKQIAESITLSETATRMRIVRLELKLKNLIAIRTSE